MSEYLICTFCEGRGKYKDAQETAEVPCCVRYFKGEKFTVWRCNSCGSIHAKDPVNLPLYYQHYPFKDHKLDYHSKVAYNNRIKFMLDRGLSKDSKILDYGCGAGIFLDYLKSRGFTDVHGYDAFIPKYASSEILNQQYDVVTSYDVIEHVEDPRAYLQELLKPLKDGGLLVLGTPNADYISLKAQPYFQVELSQPYHRHIFSERSFSKLVAEFGLRAEHTYRRFYFDSLYPMVNTRFMWEYVNQNGGFLDVCVKPINFEQVLRSPKLIFYALFGYFFPERGNILFSFRYSKSSRINLPEAKAAVGW